MEAFFEILKYVLPSLVVFITAYLIIKSFIENEQKKRNIEVKTMNFKQITPIRLQAYERLTLFVERINPESLLPRVYQQGMNVELFHTALLMTIRAEYEHNLSQQIYVSSKTWIAIKSSKESVVRLVNSTFSTLKPEAPAIELTKAIMEVVTSTERSPVYIALEMLKAETGQYF